MHVSAYSLLSHIYLESRSSCLLAAFLHPVLKGKKRLKNNPLLKDPIIVRPKNAPQSPEKSKTKHFTPPNLPLSAPTISASRKTPTMEAPRGGGEARRADVWKPRVFGAFVRKAWLFAFGVLELCWFLGESCLFHWVGVFGSFLGFWKLLFSFYPCCHLRRACRLDHRSTKGAIKSN